jgi:RimJ/RimL family protein N-acetyltransferase
MYPSASSALLEGGRGADRPERAGTHRERLHVMTEPIETERLILRPFVADDFDAVFDMQSRPEVVRYLYWDVRTETEVHTSLEKKITSTAIHSEGDILFLAAVLKDTGQLVADVVLSLVSSEHQHGEVGYTVHPDHQRRGYATEATRELLRVAFEDLKLHRVTGHLDARNVASARVLEKLGMRREAHMVENEWVKGEWQSGIVYAMLDREWQGGQPE